MNEALKALYAVQVVDSALARAQKEYAALDTGKAEQAAAETSREMHDRLVREQQRTAADLQDAELELKGVEKKKKDLETRLYGGKINVPKEMAAAEQEIEALGRQRGRLDEKILTLMDQLETLAEEVKASAEDLEHKDRAFAARQTAYKAAAQKLSVQARALMADREKKVAEVQPSLLKRYDAIRSGKHGVGIARLVDGSCDGCHMSLSSTLVTRTREGKTVETCESCGRLLVWIDE